MTSGIYLITCLPTGKVYVGQSECIKQRFYQHKSRLRRRQHTNPYLQSAWSKYGEDEFSMEIIERIPIKYLNERESYWSYVYDSCNRVCGFNIEMPGNFKKGVTAETRAKLSAARLGKKTPEEVRCKQSIALKGKPKSESHRANYGVAWASGKRGNREQIRKLGNESGKTFRLINPSGEIVTGVNLNAFCRENNLSQSNLVNVLHGKRPSHKGYRTALEVA